MYDPLYHEGHEEHEEKHISNFMAVFISFMNLMVEMHSKKGL
jgi:hypothetical protein